MPEFFDYDHRGRRAPQVRHEEDTRPHLLYLAIGFPPAAKSSAYRLRETANQFRYQGWDVTVVTIDSASWERESGLDHSLSEGVDPGIKIIELDLAREDLETDIRRFSEARALRPEEWIKELRKRERQSFPEPAFGGWRRTLESAVLDVHRTHPADLLLVTCVPYVNLAAAWRLWTEHRVPYAVDFRDGWSVDVIHGTEAFTPDSEQGRWERKVLDSAVSLWVVNDPIADFYRDRYPHRASRVHVVRNGYDKDSLPREPRHPNPADGLTFGYLGTVNFRAAHLEKVLNAWRLARQEDALLARSRFEVRGHIGAGADRGANRLVEMLRSAESDGVFFGGPVTKADVADTYARWDALVLILVGGRYVTSGKVYEYMATGLPIVSAHEVDHDASQVLAGHPLWSGVDGLDEKHIAMAFRRTAEVVITASAADRAAARSHAELFTRDALMADAVQRLADQIVSQTGFHLVQRQTGIHSDASSGVDNSTEVGGLRP